MKLYCLPLLPSLVLLPCLAPAAEIDELLDLYRDLHAHPELSFQERETSERVAAELERAGYTVTRGVGGFGVVGVLENGAGPTLLLRTDLDGLPVAEQTGLPFASRARAVEQTGEDVSVMHACGHDLHMTVFVGTAQRLAARRAEWSGTLVMIGQPAEERGAGAREMLEDGLFERFPRPDYNLALHVSAELPAGMVAYSPGWALANVDSVDITVHGIGGHGAYPHMTKDPVVLASSIVMQLQTLVSREVNPREPAVITVGSFHGGSKHNVISDRAELQLTVRSYTDAVRAQLLAGIERIARAQGLSYGLPEDKLPEVTVKSDEFTPAVWNDPDLSRRVAATLARTLGSEQVIEAEPVMGGEDFANYGRVEPRIPGFMYWLGTVAPERAAAARRGEITLPSLHSPFYAPEAQPAIRTGVTAMSAAALELLHK